MASHGEPPLELDGIVRQMLSMAGLMPATPEGSAPPSNAPVPTPAAVGPGPAPPGSGADTGAASLGNVSWLPPLESLASAPHDSRNPFANASVAPAGAEPAFYFMRDPHARPGGGMSAPGHPLPHGFGTGPHDGAALPGSETNSPVGAGVREGQTPNFVSLDAVEARPVGRDVPLGASGPNAATTQSASPTAASSSASPLPFGPTNLPAGSPSGSSPDAALAGPPAPAPGSATGSAPAPRGPGSPTDSEAIPSSNAWNAGTTDILAGRQTTLIPADQALPDRTTGENDGTAPARGGSTASGQTPRVRDDFPILSQRVNGHRLVWLDSGATTQKPNAVIDGEAEFYRRDNSNVHRGAHTMARRATDAYEKARKTVQRYLGAESADEIVFVRGATEGVNLVAQSYGRHVLRSGDEIVITHLEHHSNIVPWQHLCQQTGAILRVAPVDNTGEIILDAYERLLGPRTKIVALTHVSNVLGTLVPVAPMVAMAHRHGAKVLVDGAQAVAHIPVDVKCLDADFYVFSGHKIYAPTGVGAVYAKKALLDEMPPWQGGGSMIVDVTFERSTYAPPPAKFEAGTGNIAGAVGLGIALEYLERLGRVNVALHEEALVRYALDALRSVPKLRMVGSPRVRIGALPFVIDGRDPLAVAQALDRKGIAVRAGHHCAQPILRRFGLETSVRASLGVYNAEDDIDALVHALRTLEPL